jgi:hypothetical protein
MSGCDSTLVSELIMLRTKPGVRSYHVFIMFLYVSICFYMFLYVFICFYMFLYVFIKHIKTMSTVSLHSSR